MSVANPVRLQDRGDQPEIGGQPILEMRGISKSFGVVKALSDVNFTVMPGEIHAFVGENGAGKSTLMKVLSGVYPSGSYDGSIVFDGEERHFPVRSRMPIWGR